MEINHVYYYDRKILPQAIKQLLESTIDSLLSLHHSFNPIAAYTDMQSGSCGHPLAVKRNSSAHIWLVRIGAQPIPEPHEVQADALLELSKAVRSGLTRVSCVNISEGYIVGGTGVFAKGEIYFAGDTGCYAAGFLRQLTS